MQDGDKSSTQQGRNLVNVAMGYLPADLIIRDGGWVCVQSGEVVSHIDVAICDGRIAYVGPDASYTKGDDTVVVEADGQYLVPGLLDAHIHVESSMLTMSELVRAASPSGTTGLFIDPHEIANVFGLPGVRAMVDEAATQPIHVFVQVPSCVPSAPGLETPGAVMGPEEVTEALSWQGVIGLGEVMNVPGVCAADLDVHAKIEAAQRAGRVIGGHFASTDLGRAFHGYVAAGIEDDHEGTRAEDALARVRQGMKAMLRKASGWDDVTAQIKAITQRGLDPRHVLFCTDDCHADTLLREGHMNVVVRQAISNGLPPITAIAMATLNTAEHFGVSRDIGLIAPGRFADILLVEDLTEFKPYMVFARGELIAERGTYVGPRASFVWPDWATGSVKLARPLKGTDFRLTLPKGAASRRSVKANVIVIKDGQIATGWQRLEFPVEHGEINSHAVRDIARVAVIERHQGNGHVALGLVRGFGLSQPCGIASTVAHDCHNLVVVGNDDQSMAIAVNELAKVGGGQVVVRAGKVIGMVRLPIGGLMAGESVEKVAQQAESIMAGLIACGCRLSNPIMSLSFLALPVIPELRITDLGLVDVAKFKRIPLVETGA